MKFLAMRAGHYLINQSGTTIGSVEKCKNMTIPPRWFSGGHAIHHDQWRVTWYDMFDKDEHNNWRARPTEMFATLYDLAEAYEFENYPGYGAVLKKRVK